MRHNVRVTNRVMYHRFNGAGAIKVVHIALKFSNGVSEKQNHRQRLLWSIMVFLPYLKKSSFVAYVLYRPSFFQVASLFPP